MRDDWQEEWPGDPVEVNRQVEAVVRSVVHDDELQELSVFWARESYMGGREDWYTATTPDERVLWVRVIARGEEFCTNVWSPVLESGPGWRGALFDFAVMLQDWVCERKLARGQNRTAVVPPDLHEPTRTIDSRLLRRSGQNGAAVGGVISEHHVDASNREKLDQPPAR